MATRFGMDLWIKKTFYFNVLLVSSQTLECSVQQHQYTKFFIFLREFSFHFLIAIFGITISRNTHIFTYILLLSLSSTLVVKHKYRSFFKFVYIFCLHITSSFVLNIKICTLCVVVVEQQQFRLFFYDRLTIWQSTYFIVHNRLLFFVFVVVAVNIY